MFFQVAFLLLLLLLFLLLFSITSDFNAMRFNDNPFTCQCEKEKKNAYGFQTSHLYWSFLNDIIAVKG